MKTMRSRNAIGWLTAVTLLLPVAAGAAAPSSTLGSYAIMALDSLTLRGHVQVQSGDVGCNSPSGTIILNQSARIQGTVAGSRLQLGYHAQAGQLFCNTLQLVRPTSLTCQAMTAPLVEASALPAVQVSAGRSDVRLKPRGSMTALPPGAYGVVRVGDQGELTLAGGDYAFRSLWVGHRAQLVCEAECHIGVTTSVLLRDDAVLGAMAPLDARAVRVDVEGGTGTKAAFRAYQRSHVDATVYAPNGAVVLGVNGRYTGAFIGKTVFVYQRAQVTGASAF